MISMRYVIALVLLSPALAFGQSGKDEEDKVSNDNPGRPLQMPPASSEVKEAFDDFERFARRGAWERARRRSTRSPRRRPPGSSTARTGFIIPVGPEAAGGARRAPARGPGGVSAVLRRRGEEAARRGRRAGGAGEPRAGLLGLFPHLGRRQRGRSPGRPVLRAGAVRPRGRLLAGDPPRPPRHRSLARPDRRSRRRWRWRGRGGDRSSMQVRAELADRYADETGHASAAGRRRPPSCLERLLEGDPPVAAPGRRRRRDGRRATRASTSAGPSPPPGRSGSRESVEAGMTPVELAQWERPPSAGPCPPWRSRGRRSSRTTSATCSRSTWPAARCSGGSGVVPQPGQACDAGPGPDGSTRAVRDRRLGRVWSLGRDVKDPNYMATFRLVCRRAESGDVVWQVVRPARLRRDGLRGAADPGRRQAVRRGASRQPNRGQGSQPHQYVLAIRPHDGKLLWKTEVGIFREGSSDSTVTTGARPSPQPRLVYRAGSLYVDTHDGVLARLDAESGAVDWGYGYPTDPSRPQIVLLLRSTGCRRSRRRPPRAARSRPATPC